MDSNIIWLEVKVLSQKINRVIGNNVGDFKQALIYCRNHELHEVISEWHFFDLFFSLIFNHLDYFFGQVFPLCLKIKFCLCLFFYLFFFFVQRYLVFFVDKLLICFDEFWLIYKVIVWSSIPFNMASKTFKQRILTFSCCVVH